MNWLTDVSLLIFVTLYVTLCKVGFVFCFFFVNNTCVIIFLLSITEAAVPPWVDSNEEETIQQQILALSAVSISFPVRFEIFLLGEVKTSFFSQSKFG